MPHPASFAPVFLSALALSLGACGREDPSLTPDACPALDGATGPGTRHADAITADQTWTAAGSPHLVAAPLSLVRGATLTVEPCAVVRVAPEAGLEVGTPGGSETGHLVARGTADRPIVIERAAREPWRALVVHAPSTVTLAHTTVAGGGGDALLGGASLVGYGPGTTPAAPVMRVDTVTVTGARGHGVVLERAARFADGSRALTITGSGNAEHPEPLVVGLHGLVGLPTGRYVGNARDAIVIVDDQVNAISGLQVDTTLHDLGVAYRVGRARGDDLRVGGNGGAPATLTVGPGVVVRFQPEGQLRVVSDHDRPRGRLVVAGTAARPVTLTSLDDTDAPGAWAGVYFEAPREAPMADHDVAYVRIVNAGGDCACSLTSCSPVSTSNAAVIFDGPPARAFIHHAVITRSAAHGFLRSWLDAPELDFLADNTNTVERVAGCPQTMPERTGEVCPAPRYACTP